MKSEELKPGVYWVGAVDWAVRDFHGYVTQRGTTYNNYLVMDEDITLVDAVKYDFIDISISNIRKYADPSKIKNIIVNHIEPDHASGLARMMSLSPKAAIYCTQKGKAGLERMFDISGWDIKTVKTGDTLKIGRRTLMFLETPMLHWPDSMMTYVKEDKVLFSQDAFGQHLASSQRFDDEFVHCASMADLDDAVWDYYANILMPFGSLITRKIKEVQELGIEIDIIAPDHGIVWRQNPKKVLQMYLDMAGGRTDERVIIVYDTMWNSTKIMSNAMVEGIRAEGMDCRVLKLRSTPTSVVIKEFWRSRGCLIGAPTLNNSIFPPVGEFLYTVKGLRPKNRIVGAFGSFGWGGGAVKEIYETVKKMGLEVFEPGVEVNYRANPEETEKCFEFGRGFARAVKEYHKKF